MENQELLIAAITGILAGAYMIFKAVAKITKTKKDDKIVEAIEEVKEQMDHDED